MHTSEMMPGYLWDVSRYDITTVKKKDEEMVACDWSINACL